MHSFSPALRAMCARDVYSATTPNVHTYDAILLTDTLLRMPRVQVLRTCKSSGLESIHILKKSGGTLRESYLDEVRYGVAFSSHPVCASTSTLDDVQLCRVGVGDACRNIDGWIGRADKYTDMQYSRDDEYVLRKMLTGSACIHMCTSHHNTTTPQQGFILDKKIGVGQPKRIENAKILVANTAMDTDKVKIYGARIRADGMSKVREFVSI